MAFRLFPDAGRWWLDPLLIGTGAAALAVFARRADPGRAPAARPAVRAPFARLPHPAAVAAALAGTLLASAGLLGAATGRVAP